MAKGIQKNKEITSPPMPYTNSHTQVQQPYIPLEVGSIIIHSHTLLQAREFFINSLEKQWDCTIGHMSKITTDEMEYSFSSYHFELNMTAPAISFIKTTSKNRSIHGKPFVFFLKNLQAANRSLQLAIRHLIDSSISNCIFVFPLEKLTGIDRGILARNCIINLVKLCPTPPQVLMMDKALQTFLNKIKTNKPYDVIIQSRELAYKFYHINCPLSRICRIIIDYFSEDENICAQVVEDLTDIEYKSHIIHKDIILYEQAIFLTVSKYVPLMSAKAKRKATTTLNKPQVATPILINSMDKLAIIEKPSEPETTINLPSTDLPIKKSITIRKKTTLPSIPSPASSTVSTPPQSPKVSLKVKKSQSQSNLSHNS